MYRSHVNVVIIISSSSSSGGGGGGGGGVGRFALHRRIPQLPGFFLHVRVYSSSIRSSISSTSTSTSSSSSSISSRRRVLAPDDAELLRVQPRAHGDEVGGAGRRLQQVKD